MRALEHSACAPVFPGQLHLGVGLPQVLVLENPDDEGAPSGSNNAEPDQGAVGAVHLEFSQVQDGEWRSSAVDDKQPCIVA